jgi:hypothetical protein
VTPEYVGLKYAVDFAGPTTVAPVWAAREGVAHCELHDGNKMGWTVKVVHSPDSDLYAHADTCYMGTGNYVNVAQGRHISYTGTRASATSSVDDHLHFQRNSSSSGGEGTPQIAVAFTVEGKSSFTHSSEVNKTAKSDNLSAGYSLPPVQWEQAIHDKAFSLGWSTAGATASLSGWTPGRSPAATCGSGATAGWYQCNFTNVNGVSASGRIQTFKGAGTGAGEHGIFKRSSGAATFMSRGLLGPYTDLWSGSNDGLYLMGYPTGDSYPIGGTSVQMNFQNGYATYDTSNCSSRWYWWSTFLGLYIEQNLADYCD